MNRITGTPSKGNKKALSPKNGIPTIKTKAKIPTIKNSGTIGTPKIIALRDIAP